MRLFFKLLSTLAPPGSRRLEVLKSIGRVYRAIQRVFFRSWESYSFLRFKNQRRALYSPGLSGLRTPGIPGLTSIILPVYNGADYVREALESILAQTHTNFELIAVDDGSTDGTPQLLDEYAAREARLRVIHQSNQRLPMALNHGFRTARGEFLTWTSADNRLKPDFLARMVASLKNHPEWDGVYANVDIIGEDGRQLIDSEWYCGYQKPKGSGHVFLPRDTSELNVVANNYVGAAFLYRRHVVDLLGDYSPHRFGTEDYDFWMRFNGLLELHHVDFSEPVYDYRFHATSLTSRDEELGITQSREGLMIFEDARRDFYQMPLAWSIGGDQSVQAQTVMGSIRQWAAEAGHVLFDRLPFDLTRMSRHWSPLAAVHVTTDPGRAVPDPAWPAPSCKVLVAVGQLPISTRLDPGWDLCIAFQDDPATLAGRQLPGQGWLGVSDIRRLCAAIEVRVRSGQLAGLEAEIFKPGAPVVKISVVVCTYRRGDKLTAALRSVAAQTFPAAQFEVLVVNNDPSDASVEHAVNDLRDSDLSGGPGRWRLVLCPYKGLSCARNAGISEARGEIISFLDDDAAAAPDWLEKIWAAFSQEPQAGLVGGTILLTPPEPRPGWFKPGWEGYWSHFSPGYPGLTRVTRWHEFPYGANWSARRRLLLEMGGFRSRYGRRGSDFGGGEETIAALLIQKLGYGVFVEPRAVVRHNVDPARFTLEDVRKTIQAGLRTYYRLQTDLYLPFELNSFYMCIRLIGTIIKLPTWGLVKTWYASLAECRLFGWYAADLFRRLRKPGEPR